MSDENVTIDDDTFSVAPRSNAVRNIAVATAVVVAAFVGFLATRDQGTDEVGVEFLDQAAPPFSGPTLDGDTFDLSNQRGRWVVVNFFASWCVACVDEHPELVAFAARHAAPDDAIVVGVSFGDTVAGSREFIEQYGGDWPIIVDSETTNAVGVDYGVTALPESFVIAPSGLLVAHVTGGITADGLDLLIDRIGAAGEEAPA